MINEFRGNYFFLSNFYDKPVTYGGITYANNEAAFQAQKVLDDAIKQKFTNLEPNEAKKLGRKVKLRPDWEEVKDDIMYQIVKAKFEQNPDLRRKLLATGNQELIEGNTWHDNHFGNCSCPKCRNTKKENVLGKILMKVREELK